MFKSEKIFLFLLITGCLIISLVLIDALMDPAVLFQTAYARFSGSPEPVLDEIYNSEDLQGEGDPLIGETTELFQEGWNLFRSEGFAFQIQFPSQVVKKSALNQDALNAGIGLEAEAPVWQFRLDDPALYRDTNLVDASVIIHVLQGEDQESSCTAFKPGSIYQSPMDYRDSLIEENINGVPFWKDEVIEGVMGEFYQRISYRTFAKGACYEITQLLHYRNMDSLADESIREFDQAKVLSALDDVVSTFSFLELEPSFPELTYPLPKSLTTAVSKSTSEFVNGLDVSHWQGTIKWPKVANAGYVFTFAKGTEGVGWTDVKFHENMVNGTNAGVMMGVYHFARPDLGNSAKDEANHFLDEAGDYLKSGYLRPVLDLEVGSSLGKTALSNWVLEWMQTVENRTGIAPLIYTNPNFIYNYLTRAVTEYDLWVAHWTCEPDPSYYYPNAGKWSDWAFWQYYGPGGCGGNAGYVPGISTNIDLNIFNGVESGLQAYDAKSHLWVSLTSDAYYYPAPYYADMIGNVNGDTTGLIDFAFWWDCTSLEADLEAVQDICGALPEPADGECEYNEVGLRCQGVENEKQIAEHTYQEIGNYTAKVIVVRGEESPVEDRYKITTYNPIRTTVSDPVSPSVAVIDDPFSLSAAVTLHTSVEGVLQLTLQEEVSGDVVSSACIPVLGDNESTETFEFVWSETSPLEKNYEVWTRYRARGTCPIEDQHENDIVQPYQVYWLDEKAILELRDREDLLIPDEGLEEIGGIEPFQQIELDYLAANPSAINSYEISSISFANVENAVNLQFEPELPLEVGPEGQVPLTISFEVQTSGEFSFDVVIDHSASNPVPFQFTVRGEGVLSNNPIQLVAPAPLSPGEGFPGADYRLEVDVDLNPPVDGVLQVSVVDQDGAPVSAPACIEVPGGLEEIYGVDFSWTDPASGQAEYLIWARYRELGLCPVTDVSPFDISQGYVVDWLEDSPVLTLLTADATPVVGGEADNLGELAPYQVRERSYLLENSSPTKAYQITEVAFDEIANVEDLSIISPLPLEVGPLGQETLTVQYTVSGPGAFSADLGLAHTASNPDPYLFTIQGSGVLAANPVQSLDVQPLSPGERLIDQSYSLQIAAEVEAPVEGAVVISVSRPDGTPLEGPFCQIAAEPGAGLYTYTLDWSEGEPALQQYLITGSFHAREGCPPSNPPIGEATLAYQIDWQEELPVLEAYTEEGTQLASGDVLSLGQYEYYQTGSLTVQLGNQSATTPLGITSVRVENPLNLGQVDLPAEIPLELDPEARTALDLSFLVDSTGPFSFDLVVEHTGSNPTPFRLTIGGSGVMKDNPIAYVVPDKPSPGASLIGSPFSMAVELGLDAPDQGALQVTLIEEGTDSVADTSCQNLVDNLGQARTLNLVVNQQEPGMREYSLKAQYRPQETCPILGESENDLTQTYRISWEEEIPSLLINREDGSDLPAGIIDDLGEQEFYQTIQRTYLLRNTSSTSSLDIEALRLENPANLDEITISPVGPITLGPGEEQSITLAFRIQEPDAFQVDLEVFHTGENASPYQATIAGQGVISSNPIRSILVDPVSPGSLFVDEEFRLNIEVEIEPPAPGVIGVLLRRQDTLAEMGRTCFEIPGEQSYLDLELSWTEGVPGDYLYDLEVAYQALGTCPFTGSADAEQVESYQALWLTDDPELIVNRPEGVTIFDGAVDYIGRHDFFRFVEVTYLISNGSDSGVLVIEGITPESLVNLREVIIEPAGVIEIGPGDSQEVKISFQVLTLDPYTFDLVWEHNGANPTPYVTSILGESKLNLGDAPSGSWLYRFLESLIRSGFFLKLPIVGLILVRRKKR